MTHVSPAELFGMTPHQLRLLPGDRFKAVLQTLLDVQRKDRMENQILWYEPASRGSMKVHESFAQVRGIGGGNGSSKSETAIVELVAKATGIFPRTLAHLAETKFRGPINCRHVCESLTTVLEPVILPKLQWWKWTGALPQDGEKGHWGWIPRKCLKDGMWDRSWSAKLRTLTVICYNPKNPDKPIGESLIQFMSNDQEGQDAASGEFHEIVLDEPPPWAIWRESQARTMRVGGNITLAMTWPEDPAIAVDYLFDEIWEAAKKPENLGLIETFELITTDNKKIDLTPVLRQMGQWSDDTKSVRIFGKSIRFSNRIHPEFTDIEAEWCFTCNKRAVHVSDGKCITCGGANIVTYCHVKDFPAERHWPTIFVLDPHPRKPHMWLHVQVDPADDLWVVDGGELDAEPVEVAKRVLGQEADLRLPIALRLIDPNMGRSPANARKREETWQDEFDAAGLHCDLASDADVGRGRVNEYLRPDPQRKQPRLHVHPRAALLAAQMLRYAWDDYKKNQERGLKERPRDRYDDGPTMLKYVLNMYPSYSALADGSEVIQMGNRRRVA